MNVSKLFLAVAVLSTLALSSCGHYRKKGGCCSCACKSQACDTKKDSCADEDDKKVEKVEEKKETSEKK